MVKVKKKDKEMLIAIESFLERSKTLGLTKDVESAERLRDSILQRYGMCVGYSRFNPFGRKNQGYTNPYDLEVEEEEEGEDETV